MTCTGPGRGGGAGPGGGAMHTNNWSSLGGNDVCAGIVSVDNNLPSEQRGKVMMTLITKTGISSSVST